MTRRTARLTSLIGHHRWTLALALGAAVFLVAVADILMTRESGRIAPIWPVNALTLAIILSTQRRNWVGLLAAAFVGNVAANLTCGDPAAVAVLLASANSLEIAVVAWLVGRRGGLRLMRRSSLERFGGAAVIGCLVSMVAAEAGLMLTGATPTLQGAGLWLAADVLGLLIFTPLLLAALDSRSSGFLGENRAGSAVALLGLIGVSVVIFTQSSLPLLFIPPAALTLVAIRSGPSGAALGVLVVSIIAITATFLGYGPITLVRGDETLKIIILQLFLATLTVISLTVGATFAERPSFVNRLTMARTGRRTKSLRERQLVEHAQLAERMSQVGYWTLNTVTHAVFWSPEVYRIHGVSPEDYRPGLEDALDFYDPADRQRVTDLVSQHAVAGDGWEFDAVLVRRSDGARRNVRSMASCQKDTSGAVIGFFGVFKDLTDERQAIAAAVEQERRYRLLADNASDVIAVYDVDGVFTYLSPSIRDLLGYTPEELIGRRTYDVIVPDDHTRVAADFAKAANTRLPLTVEYRATAKDGSVRWLEARPRFQRDETDTIIEVNDSVRDVTERRERETALAQARAIAEDAVRTKADFLSNMSHEIRTPLNGVLGFAEVLANTGLNTDQRRYVDRIRSAGKGLSVLIDDILDSSKIEAGKMTIERRAFDLKGLVTDVLDLTQTGVGDRLAMHVEFEDDVAPWAFGDEQRIRQVLLNLLGNAAKFTHEGSVTLKVCLVDGNLQLRIRDTGIGISAEAMSRLFTGFTQADASFGRRFGGTGLGLNISRSLARLMGGDIRLESEPNVGTTAIFTLPYEAADAPPPDVGATTAPSASRSLNVLAVDDVEANLELVEILLTGAGHSVSRATCGEAAIEALRANMDFDLVLMDVQMPGMDGLAATRTIRAMGGAAARIPIVALTANVMAEQIAACRAAGMDDHLGKPVKSNALFDLIQRVGVREAQPSAPSRQDRHGDDPLAALKARYKAQMATFQHEFERIASLPDDRRPDAVAAYAHSIAGTAGSLGFPDVSTAAFELEAAAKRCRDEGMECGELETFIQKLIAIVACA